MKAKQSGSVTHPSPAASKAIGSAGEVTSAHGEPGIYTLSSDGAPSKAEKAADILASCKASGSVAAPSTPAVRYTLSPDMLSTPTSKRKRPAPASESPPEVQARPTGKRKRHVRVLEGKKLPEQALAKGIASTPPKNIHRIRAAALAAAVAAVTAAEDEVLPFLHASLLPVTRQSCAPGSQAVCACGVLQTSGVCALAMGLKPPRLSNVRLFAPENPGRSALPVPSRAPQHPWTPEKSKLPRAAVWLGWSPWEVGRSMKSGSLSTWWAARLASGVLHDRCSTGGLGFCFVAALPQPGRCGSKQVPG